MTELRTPTTDELFMMPLRDPELKQYYWGTFIRVTEDGETIADVRDVLDAPNPCDWGNDEFGLYAIVPESVSDPRHYAVQVFDSRVWEAFMGHHSPSDEMRFANDASPAVAAKKLLSEYRAEARVVMDELGIDADEMLISLTRTLKFDGDSHA